MSKSRGSSPKRFSEKIALLNKSQTDTTAAFERILREVGETTRFIALSPPKNSLRKRASVGSRNFTRDSLNHSRFGASSVSPPTGPSYAERGYSLQQQPPAQFYGYPPATGEPRLTLQIPSIKIVHIDDQDEHNQAAQPCLAQPVSQEHSLSNLSVNVRWLYGDHQRQADTSLLAMNSSNSSLEAETSDLSASYPCVEASCKMHLFPENPGYTVDRRMSTSQNYEFNRTYHDQTNTETNTHPATFYGTYSSQQIEGYWNSADYEQSNSLQCVDYNQKSPTTSSITRAESSASLDTNFWTKEHSAAAAKVETSNFLDIPSKQQFNKQQPLKRSSSCFCEELPSAPISGPDSNNSISFKRSNSYNNLNGYFTEQALNGDYQHQQLSPQLQLTRGQTSQASIDNYHCQCDHCSPSYHYPVT